MMRFLPSFWFFTNGRGPFSRAAASGFLFIAFTATSGAQCESPDWQAGEGIRGLEGTVRSAVLWDRDGPGGAPPVLVVGGDFTIAGTTAARDVALWNGSNWEALGTGTEGAVWSLAAMPDGSLVAGGGFLKAGGVAVNRIARWNGSVWAPLGTGMTGSSQDMVNVLKVMPDGSLMAGGYFAQAGGTAVSGLARWDGAAWSPVGGGVSSSSANTPGTVQDLALLPNGDLVATGIFDKAGGIPVASIARWNGSSWSALGSGLSNGYGNALIVMPDGTLVAAGSFTFAGGVSVANVAAWNGSVWSPMGSTAYHEALNKTIFDLAILSDGTLVAGGSYDVSTGGAANYVARWNGAQWVPMGSGMNNYVDTLLALPDGGLVAGGQFLSAGGKGASHLAKWDGTSWGFYGSGFGGGSNGSILGTVIKCFTRLSNGDVVAGGVFTFGGESEARNVARWNGRDWFALGAGLDAEVDSLTALPNGEVIAGGIFQSSGGVPMKYLAHWNGSAWLSVGTGSNGPVYALATLPGGRVAAGGLFTAVDGVNARNIALWDGSVWSPLDSGTSGAVNALAVMPNGDLMAGGEFASAGGLQVSTTARWDGKAWSALGSGTNGTVYSLSVSPNGSLVAGGRFGRAGGIVSPGAAVWNGSVWQGLGDGLSGSQYSVYAVTALSNGDIVAGGNFNHAGSVAARNVARWNGSAWSSPGSGTSISSSSVPYVYSLLGLPQGGFVMGGAFTYVNDRVDADFAYWGCPFYNEPAPPDALPQLTAAEMSVSGFHFAFHGRSGKTYDIEYSPDLKTWKAIQSGLSGEVSFTDVDPARKAELKGYYRAVEK